jgi:hypothetical protein
VQDSYYINYKIGEAKLTIRLFTINLMTIPYSQIAEIEFGSVFVSRPAQIDLSSSRHKGCRIKKVSRLVSLRYNHSERPQNPNECIQYVSLARRSSR